MHSGSIQMVTTTDGTSWSGPTQLVPQANMKNRYYPTFAPDSSFVVYDESTCTSGGMECDADTDPSARMFAVTATAGNAPIELARANAPGIADGNNRALTNTYPKWSPFVFQRTSETGSRLMWITFSSTRQYGLRNPPPSPNGGTENPDGTLIWMAAIEPDKVAQRQDPSYPAFALPFQDTTTSNHIAQWAQRLVAGPSPDGGVPDGGSCGGNGAACTAATCCAGYICTGGHCGAVP
jgi:hypothetical protein